MDAENGRKGYHAQIDKLHSYHCNNAKVSSLLNWQLLKMLCWYLHNTREQISRIFRYMGWIWVKDMNWIYVILKFMYGCMYISVGLFFCFICLVFELVLVGFGISFGFGSRSGFGSKNWTRQVTWTPEWSRIGPGSLTWILTQKNSWIWTWPRIGLDGS